MFQDRRDRLIRLRSRPLTRQPLEVASIEWPIGSSCRLRRGSGQWTSAELSCPPTTLRTHVLARAIRPRWMPPIGQDPQRRKRQESERRGFASWVRSKPIELATAILESTRRRCTAPLAVRRYHPDRKPTDPPLYRYWRFPAALPFWGQSTGASTISSFGRR